MASTPNNRRAEKKSARQSFWLGLAVIALAFIIGAALTWRRWPDLVIDFGLQLYLPQQIAHGAILYRDLYYLAGGPLSQYFHAALFKIFGASFLTLIVANLTITAAMLVVIYERFRAATNTFTGTAIALTVIAGFAFAQYTGIGNNNYLAPYSHELLHGLALSIFAVALLARWLDSGAARNLWLAGFCCGLVALTKPDISIALGLTTAAAFVMAAKSETLTRSIVKSVGGFFLAALIPLMGFFFFFLRTENWRESLRLEFFGWRPLFLGSVVKDPYYQWSLGFDAPFDHLRQTSIHFLVTALVVIACAGIFKAIKHVPNPTRCLLTGVALVGLLFAAKKFNWQGGGASLPLLCLVTGGLLLKKFRDGSRDHALIFPLLWSVFALLLLAKQGVFPRIWHTGFALAMPAFVTAAYLFLWLLPEFLESSFQVPRRPMRIAAAGVLLVACFSLMNTSASFYSAKNLAVGKGADVIFARGPGVNSVEARNMNLALDWIATNVPPDATLAAIPQGAMLNFLSRHANSTPCLDWNPTMLAAYGAMNMTHALATHPPDFIALVEWQTYEFGTGYFGTDGYGQDVMAWIQTNYQPVALFGSEPLRNGLFGIKILKYQPASAGTNNIEKPPASP